MKGLPPISNLPSLPTQDRAAILDYLFEPCVPLHTLSLELLRDKSFADYHDLISSNWLQGQNTISYTYEGASQRDSRDPSCSRMRLRGKHRSCHIALGEIKCDKRIVDSTSPFWIRVSSYTHSFHGDEEITLHMAACLNDY